MEEEGKLLERVFNKLIGCTEDELGNQLKLLLVPILDKLKSPFEQSRKKTMEILNHITKRIKGNAAVQLPFQGLLEQYQKTDNALLRNVNLIYLEMAWNRLANVEQGAAAWELVKGVSSFAESHRLRFFHLFLRGLLTAKVDASVISLSDADKQVLAELLTLLVSAQIQQNVPNACSRADQLAILGEALNRYTGPIPHLRADQELLSRKLVVVDALSDRIFTVNQIFPPLLIASCDNHHAVQKKAYDK
jgi:hypothetical protein